MKVVKFSFFRNYFKILMLLSLTLLGVSCGSSPNDSDAVIVDESLTLGENFSVLNEGLADRDLGIMSVLEGGKVALVTDLVIIDPVDDAGLQALLEKYNAQIVSEPEIALTPNWVLGEGGITELPSTERVLKLDLSRAIPGEAAAFAQEAGAPLPIRVSNQATLQWLNLISQMQREDSGKIKNLRPAAYAIGPAESSPDNKNLAVSEWAECECLQTASDIPGNYELRWGATWHDETRSAPIYNPFIRPNPNTFCTHNDGVASDGTFPLQGENVLTVQFSSVYDNREGDFLWWSSGPEGNVHLWAFDPSDLPLSLPGKYDTAIPVGGIDLILKGPRNKCEWTDPNPEQYIAYQNFVAWPWPSDSVQEVAGLFLWEGDECINLFLFEICNPDDPIAYFEVSREATLNPAGRVVRDIDLSDAQVRVVDHFPERGVDLTLKTVEFCRNHNFQPDIKEYCNGYDDTCDGEVDEGFPVGEACNNAGQGQCFATGTLVCTSEKQQIDQLPATRCNTPPRQASPFEICDGIDNDCDGATDEDWIQQGLACGLGVGTCGVGALGCTGGVVSCEGEILPEAEICDGLDNDCDGVTDEGCPCAPGDSRECSINLGPCTLGIQACDGGNWSEICSGVVPEPEVCDGIDNNCNGAVDEGVLNACGGCGPVPPEICDGLDNDCDGAIDEGVANSCGGCWVEGPEEPHGCDGIDNDCDGAVDERDAPIYCGVGVCQRDSVSLCLPCQPGTSDFANEFFDIHCDNGLDDDCDGLTDIEDNDCWALQGGGG